MLANIWHLEADLNHVRLLIYVCHCHALDKFSLSESYISKRQDAFTESDIFTAELVLDFLGPSSTVPDDVYIIDVIQYLCTL